MADEIYIPRPIRYRFAATTPDGSYLYTNDIPSTSPLYVGNDISWSGWCRPPVGTDIGTAVCFSDVSVSSNNYCQVRAGATNWEISVRVGGGASVGSGPAVSTYRGKWTHLALTIRSDGLTYILYINGVKAIEATVGGDHSPSTGYDGLSFNIGRRTTGTFEPWTAAYSDFAFYPKELTANEVADLYKHQRQSSIRYAVAEFRFDGTLDNQVGTTSSLLINGSMSWVQPPVINSGSAILRFPGVAAPPGGLSIPIAAYHYNHNTGSNL